MGFMRILVRELREIERIPDEVDVDKPVDHRRIFEEWRENDLVDRTIKGEIDLVVEYDRRMDIVVENGRLFYPTIISDQEKVDIEELIPIVGVPPTLELNRSIHNPVFYGLIGWTGSAIVLYGTQEGIGLLTKRVNRKEFLKISTLCGLIIGCSGSFVGLCDSLLNKGVISEGRENAEFIEDVVRKIYPK